MIAVEQTTEKTALVSLRDSAMFRTTCEVLDTPDPDVKVFRVKEGCKWGNSNNVRALIIYSHWSEFDVGQREGRYRITAVQDVPSGYIAVLKGTTKPVICVETTPESMESERCGLAIMAALESEPQMTLHALKRKTNAHRRKSAWDAALKKLTDEGKIAIETKRGLANTRVWVTRLSTESETERVFINTVIN